MAILGLIFKQKRTIIGRQDPVDGIVGEALSLVGGVGGIVVDATISEDHKSDCDVTENPVEEGAKITDHVQLKPAELSIEGIISDTPFGITGLENFENAVASIGIIGGNVARSVDIYNQLIELQKKREPFSVVTGLRQYKNMIMTSLAVPRNNQTGRAIIFRANMKEIRIVSSQTGLDNLKDSVKDIGSKTKNAGQKVTEATKPEGQIEKQATDSGGEGQKNGSFLYNLLN